MSPELRSMILSEWWLPVLRALPLRIISAKHIEIPGKLRSTGARSSPGSRIREGRLGSGFFKLLFMLTRRQCHAHLVLFVRRVSHGNQWSARATPVFHGGIFVIVGREAPCPDTRRHNAGVHAPRGASGRRVTSTRSRAT